MLYNRSNRHKLTIMNKHRYQIIIKTKQNKPALTAGLLKPFGCFITEQGQPDKTGQRDERNLIFIDSEGKELNSFVFEDLAFFFKLNKEISEVQEIKTLIYTTLKESYGIESSDVEVDVRAVLQLTQAV